MQRLLFNGAGAQQQLASALAGAGIDGISSAVWRDDEGGRVVWRMIRDEKDHLGGRHIFYRQFYVPPSWVAQGLDTSNTEWEDLPNLMMLAAYHLYKNCPIGHPGDPALAEQEAVNDAFTAIGYPGSGYYECPN